MSQKPSVLVLGAGMAGLGAAIRLQEQGCKVTILEGRNRAGGRVHTSQELGAPLDLGGAWVHSPKGNPITQLIQRYGLNLLETRWEEEEAYRASGGYFPDGPYEQAADRFESALEDAKERSEDWDDDMSIGRAIGSKITQGLSGDVKKAMDYVISDFEITQAADLDQLSTWYTDEDDEFSGEDRLVKEGYGALLPHLVTGLDLRIGQTVKEILLRPNEVWVKTQNSEFRAEFVIITFPLGVLKSGSVKITPALYGDKKRAVERLGMGHFAKAALSFPQQSPWPFKEFWVSIIPDQGNRFSQWVNMYPVVGKKILVNLAGGSTAKLLEQDTPAALSPYLHQLLCRATRTQLSTPEKLLITSWGKDPYSLGAYSFMATDSSFEDIDALAEPHEKRILFAGEATAVIGKGKNKSYYPATVHGAWMSGLREADRILSMVR